MNNQLTNKDALQPEEDYKNILINWAEKCGYFLEIEKNIAFDEAYNCYIRRDVMDPDKCIKAFVYHTPVQAVEAACEWLNKRYVKRCANMPRKEV
jgi:hypothetical protein